MLGADSAGWPRRCSARRRAGWWPCGRVLAAW